MAFYSALGKHPIQLEHEIPGHVANRLQAALWREAFHLLERGVASVADIDAAIAYGPGLRWGLLGPFLNLHLSGGDGGLRHVLEHLGPPIEQWWDDLGDPRLTARLCETAMEGVEQELDGLDLTDLVARRDELLIDLLLPRRNQGVPVTVEDFVYVRLFTADDGRSRLEDVRTRLEPRNFAPRRPRCA